MHNPEYPAPIPARYMTLRITLEPIPRFRAPARAQGCSTLWNAEEVEEPIEAADGGAEAVLGK